MRKRLRKRIIGITAVIVLSILKFAKTLGDPALPRLRPKHRLS
jgi:hypothetical protein